MDAEATTEQRQSRRYQVRCPIVFSGDLIDGRGTIEDLSTTGCGVRTGRSIKGCPYVHLFLYLPDEDLPMKIELAAVRWSKINAFGLEFIRLSQDQQKRLQQFLNFLDRRPAH